MAEDKSADNRLREIQHHIRQNAMDTSSYLAELQQWENDIRKKDAELLQAKDSGVPPAPASHPIRKSSNGISYGNKKAEPKTVKSEKKTMGTIGSDATAKTPRIKSYDYAAWDKFDVDRACDDVDYRTPSDDEKSEPVATPPIANGATAPKTNVEDKTKQAELEKSLGNEMFEKGRFPEAVAHYTRAMELDDKNPIYPANRAMANLKLNDFSAAESDCTIALSLDANYVKAYHRRATARLSLKNFQGAKADFTRVISLDASNKDAKEKLKTIQEWEAKYVKPTAAKQPLASKKLGDLEMRPVVSQQIKTPAKPERTDGKIRVYPVEKSNLSLSKKPLRNVPIQDGDANESEPLVEKTVTVSAVAASKPPPVNHAAAQFSSSGNSTVLPPKNAMISSREFFQSCAALCSNAAAAADYIQNIDPSWYIKLIGHNLEADIFNTVFLGSLAFARRSALKECFAHLVGLSVVPRLGFFAHCISQADKKEFAGYLSKMAKENVADVQMLRDIGGKFLIDLP
ncbi:RNA polymerase II-associated protein 3-like [Paramacrobiotus metropolitanus]|uniref:RNA polymerase II-associated protein 3-like n=1 Tax=Paramacrobiotus metropolitanus TaxID=2943436 RepID=UPI00244643BE|nr:RNA polymerase II-associated protein 3-like [Paramacrobiotus metropolitanus]